MSEWTSVIAVYWGLWAIDGLRFGPRRVFSLVRGRWRFGTHQEYHHLILPGLAPFSWRITATDVPLSLSSDGVANLPAGSAGRPVERPVVAEAWRWGEIWKTGVAKGWIFINDRRFCPDTGHVTAAELLNLAQLEPEERASRIHALMRRWFRPAHLGRRARVLIGRTRAAASLNAIALAMTAMLSAYVVADIPSFLEPAQAATMAGTLPWLLLVLLALHLAGMALAWRALRRLRPAIGPDKRPGAMLSALLLPPQALKLRLLASEGLFPAQHPLVVTLTFASEARRNEIAFNTVADLRWPIVRTEDPPLSREIAAWFRTALEPLVVAQLRAGGLEPAALVGPPIPDAPASCLYCPRCQDQFTARHTRCPFGIDLLPMPPPRP